MDAPAKRIGRPPKPPELRRVTVTFRLLPDLAEKVRRLGNERLEAWVARAREEK